MTSTAFDAWMSGRYQIQVEREEGGEQWGGGGV